MKKVINVIGIILAVIVSLALCCALLAAALSRGADKAVQPEGLSDILGAVDYGELLEDIDYAALLDGIGDVSIPGTGITLSRDILLEGIDAVDKEALAELYVQDVISLLREDGGAPQFTASSVENVLSGSQDALLSVVDRHFDADSLRESIVSGIAEQFAAFGSEEAQKAALDSYLQQHEAEVQWAVDAARAAIAAAMPTAIHLAAEKVMEQVPAPETAVEELERTMEENDVRDTVHTLRLGLLGLCAVLSLLVFLLRFPRWKGLAWLGVDYLLSAGGILCTAALLPQRRVVRSLAAAITEEYKLDAVVASGASYLSALLRQDAKWLAIAGAALLLLFLLLRLILSIRKRRNKRKAEKTAAKAAATAQEPEDAYPVYPEPENIYPAGSVFPEPESVHPAEAAAPSEAGTAFPEPDNAFSEAGGALLEAEPDTEDTEPTF